MQALKNLCHPSKRLLDCGVYTGEKICLLQEFHKPLAYLGFKLRSIICEYPTASSKSTIDVVPVGFTNGFCILVFDGYCHGEACQHIYHCQHVFVSSAAGWVNGSHQVHADELHW